MSVRGLRVTRAGREVLANVDLDAPKGQVTVIVAPSGTGKSTLLRCLNRLLEPDAGDITLDGVNIRSPRLGCSWSCSSRCWRSSWQAR